MQSVILLSGPLHRQNLQIVPEARTRREKVRRFDSQTSPTIAYLMPGSIWYPSCGRTAFIVFSGSMNIKSTELE